MNQSTQWHPLGPASCTSGPLIIYGGEPGVQLSELPEETHLGEWSLGGNWTLYQCGRGFGGQHYAVRVVSRQATDALSC